MKRSILIMLLILATLNLIEAQHEVATDSISELPKELFQRWKLDYGTANGARIEGLPQSPVNDYEFMPNGTYFLYKRNGSYMIGTWEYRSDEQMLYTRRDDGEINGKVADIKAKSITLIPAGEAVEGTPFENFRFFYIPKEK